MRTSLRARCTSFSALALFMTLAWTQASRAEDAPGAVRFTLSVPTTPFATLPSFLPNARGSVEVKPGARTDRMQIHLEGLPANLDLVVFLTELPLAPFGAVQYIADMKTDEDGEAEVEVEAVLFDAFAFSLPVGARPAFPNTPLDHVVIWPGDPVQFRQATGFVNPKTGATVVTPFNSDGRAGPAILTDGCSGALGCTNFGPGPLAR
ncbi:MAG: hypothetical protein NVS2B9_13930 [Myxococcales bacterium]